MHAVKVVIPVLNTSILFLDRHLIEDMFNDLCRIAEEGHLKAPRNTLHELKDYRTALDNALKPFVSRKQLLVINSL